MSSAGRIYEYFWIFLDNKNNKPIWNSSEWENYYEPLFRPLLKLSSFYDKTGLRVLAYEPSKMKENAYSEVKYGKLGWDVKSHRKWTTNENDLVRFVKFQSWTPKWTICEKIDSSPDVYISITSEKGLYSSSIINETFEFDSFITVAITKDLVEHCVDMLIEISNQISAIKTVYIQRTWSKGTPDPNMVWSLKNSIQDVDTYGVYKNGDGKSLHDCKLSNVQFDPYWNVIYKRPNNR